jgi:hypothetical protein
VATDEAAGEQLQGAAAAAAAAAAAGPGAPILGAAAAAGPEIEPGLLEGVVFRALDAHCEQASVRNQKNFPRTCPLCIITRSGTCASPTSLCGISKSSGMPA